MIGRDKLIVSATVAALRPLFQTVTPVIAIMCIVRHPGRTVERAFCI